MDLASILGIIIGLGSILGGQVLEGGHVSSIMQPTAALIVLGGTAGAVMLNFPGYALKASARGVKTVFMAPKHDAKGAIEILVKFANLARREGIIAVEKGLGDVKDPFMRKALGLAIDGNEASAIRGAMEVEIARTEEEGEFGPKVFESFGGFAPTVGVLGAVLGLIHVMENLSDPSKLGSGIAVAFVATVYGVGAANLFALPMAGKLKLRAHEQIVIMELVLEGVTGIVEGQNPRLIEEKLRGYLHDDHGHKEEKKAA